MPILIAAPILIGIYIIVGLLVIGLIVAAIGIVIALRNLPTRSVGVTPQPNLPGSRVPSECGLAGLQQPGPDAPAIALDGTVTSGTLLGSEITLPDGVRIDLTGDLTMVARDDLVINGDIRFPFQGGPFQITLVSLAGTVRIGRSAIIGLEAASPGRPDVISATDARAQGPPGSNGGTIKVVGVNIDVLGAIRGNAGGNGGNAFATGIAAPRGGSASAVSGGGGLGGEVRLCAYESIHVGSDAGISGGRGGHGGRAVASASNGSVAFAQGGPGGIAGDVIFASTLLPGFTDPTVCQVFIDPDAIVVGGDGGLGGEADASGGDGAVVVVGRGGDAEAEARPAGPGATVRFEGRCVVINRGVIGAGDGGRGDRGHAKGGRGRDGLLFGGYTGGNARASGGDGGPPGDPPRIPLPDGSVGTGAVGRPGNGGEAEATPGAGGAGGPLGGSGAAGVGEARGGRNGSGGAPPPTETSTDPDAPAVSPRPP